MDYINFGITLILVFMTFSFAYFPKKRENNERKKMQEDLREGDKVITYSGLSGVIKEIKRDDDRVILKLMPNQNIEVTIEKWAIAGLDERN